MTTSSYSTRSLPRTHVWLHHGLPLLLALSSLLIALAGPDASVALRYERAAILDGEMWRLVSGHLVHLGWSRLVLNLAGLALIWGLYQRRLAGFERWGEWLACAA